MGPPRRQRLLVTRTLGSMLIKMDWKKKSILKAIKVMKAKMVVRCSSPIILHVPRGGWQHEEARWGR